MTGEVKPARKRASIDGQIEEVRYELKQRAEVYPRIAGRDQRKHSELKLHVERMQDVLATLEFCRDNKTVIQAAHRAAIIDVSVAQPGRIIEAGIELSIVEHTESFEIRDASGTGYGYVYFEDERQRALDLKRLSRAHALRVARQIVGLPADQ